MESACWIVHLVQLHNYTVLSLSRSSLFIFACMQDLEQKKFEELLGKIQNVVDDRTKAVKGKMGQQKQRLNVIKKGVNLMLDVCRKTHCDLELKIEGDKVTANFISVRVN